MLTLPTACPSTGRTQVRQLRWSQKDVSQLLSIQSTSVSLSYFCCEASSLASGLNVDFSIIRCWLNCPDSRRRSCCRPCAARRHPSARCYRPHLHPPHLHWRTRRRLLALALVEAAIADEPLVVTPVLACPGDGPPRPGPRLGRLPVKGFTCCLCEAPVGTAPPTVSEVSVESQIGPGAVVTL